MSETQATCPNCGYCPHCGRSTQPYQPVPMYPMYPQPFHPWWVGPMITWTTGDTQQPMTRLTVTGVQDPNFTYYGGNS